ncbi:hypothetical protein MTR_8g088350 [Medicago truncatula]|uniref:Uncharacterized protein n=1 Tax=Medicago truncatula TaxID=3880 RepID=G7L838_MEDTR|nr:hypothetical protein MTR_8g088350 [Medicago truncatula]
MGVHCFKDQNAKKDDFMKLNLQFTIETWVTEKYVHALFWGFQHPRGDSQF